MNRPRAAAMSVTAYSAATAAQVKVFRGEDYRAQISKA
jgi:hypothetical protein